MLPTANYATSASCYYCCIELTGEEAEGSVDPQAGEEPQQGAARGGRGARARRAAAAAQGLRRQVLVPRPAAAAAAHTRPAQSVICSSSSLCYCQLRVHKAYHHFL